MPLPQAQAVSGVRNIKVESLPDVGQAGSLRGGWLPPLSGANARGTLWVGPIANRPQLTKLPHNSAPSLAYTYARSQSALLMNCVGVHFCVAQPLSPARYSCLVRSLV
jgi:hypothetical protein